MTLAPGSRLGPYEVLSPIGAGGMGEVYKAQDTRLGRTVAVKVLPEHLSSDPGFRERFEREARAVSSLNHPHICTLHDVGEHEGVHYLVMEHLEGETLADRLKKRALPLATALELAAQIADALDNAHREGVVHRDLKPGNVMLLDSGVKLLDFGLAKVHEGPVVPTEDSEQPTRNKPLTGAGTILGTVQYMAPEQLEGKDVDARADLFSLGAILFEMITGRRAFEGQSQASLISAIMSAEPPPVSALESLSPEALDRIVKRCLTKDPDARWQTARDLAEELRWVRDRSGAPARISGTAATLTPKRLVVVGVASGLAALVGAWVARLPRSPLPASQVVRLRVGLEYDSEVLVASNAPSLALSPDGRFLVMVAGGSMRHLLLRDLATLNNRRLPGTETSGYHPFFSPDGSRIAFTTSGSLKTISVNGGEPHRIGAVDGVFAGGSWSDDDRILFSSGNAVRLVSAGGGSVETVLELEEDELALSPHWLPGARYALVSLKQGNEYTLQSFDLESRALRPLLASASQAKYVGGGYLLFGRYDSTGTADVFAVRFDPDPPSLRGDPVPVSEPDNILASRSFGGWFFDVSETGTLAYVPGEDVNFTRLVWVEAGGTSTALPIEPDVFRRPSLSPDGRRLAVGSHPGGGVDHDVWIYHLDTGARSLLTVEGHNASPIWTPDGHAIAFASRRPLQDVQRIFTRPADGSRAAELLVNGANEVYPTSWSPDGRTLAYVEVSPTEKSNIWTLSSGKEPEPVLTTSFEEHSPMFSPDGHWLAYVSDESGREEVYVRPFPGDGNYPISTNGGHEPVWARDGKRLFFRNLPGDEMWAASVELAPTFRASRPELVFKRPFFHDTGRHQTYDVSADGERFLMVEALDATASRDVVVVINWAEELKRLFSTQ